MKNKWNLSEQINHEATIYPATKFIYVEDVKEFIKRMKEITRNCISGGCDEELVMKNIDKLAGEKLI